jgi:hypothetical protein
MAERSAASFVEATSPISEFGWPYMFVIALSPFFIAGGVFEEEKSYQMPNDHEGPQESDFLFHGAKDLRLEMAHRGEILSYKTDLEEANRVIGDLRQLSFQSPPGYVVKLIRS